MTIYQKIEKLDKFSKGAFSITHYLEWEFVPYEGLLSQGEDYYIKHGYVFGKTFKECINKAYEAMINIKKI